MTMTVPYITLIEISGTGAEQAIEFFTDENRIKYTICDGCLHCDQDKASDMEMMRLNNSLLPKRMEVSEADNGGYDIYVSAGYPDTEPEYIVHVGWIDKEIYQALGDKLEEAVATAAAILNLED